MTEQDKEIQELKERVKYLEGVIEGISRGMVSKPLPWYGPMMPQPSLPYWQTPFKYEVTC